MASHRPVMFLLALLALPASAPPTLLAVEPLDVPPDVAEVLHSRYPMDLQQLKLIQGQVQRVAKQAMPATVGLLIGPGAGSGVIVSKDGLVLTAAHVIGKADRRARVLLPDGRRLRARTLGADHDIDAGMLQITDPPDDLPFLPVAAQRPEIGEWVVTLGQPGGTVADRSPPLRLGRVLARGDDWMCTDCTLVGGDSGGPLINMRGEVLGVHSSIGAAIVHNFHIPVSEIKQNWDRLLAGEVWGGEPEQVRPMIGIAGQTKDGQCLVTQVFPGLPAFDADMRPGDIILEVDGHEISRFEEVSQRVMEKQPGQKMRIRIERAGASWEVEMTLAGVADSDPGSNSGKSKEGEQ